MQKTWINVEQFLSSWIAIIFEALRSKFNATIFNIIRWVGCTKDSLTKRLMFQVLFFFTISCKNSLQTSFQFIFLSFNNFTKMKIKSFKYSKSMRNYEKNYALNIRSLVDELFVTSTQRASI